MLNFEQWSKKYKDSIDCENPKGFLKRHTARKTKERIHGTAVAVNQSGLGFRPTEACIKSPKEQHYHKYLCI